MDIIDEYMKIVKPRLDAPEVFIEASAYHLVSALLGRFFRCSAIKMGEWGCRPNVWFIISSIPGRARRSTVSNYSNYVYRKSLAMYNQKKLAIDERGAKTMVYDSIIEAGTPEGMIDHVNATKLDVYSIQSTEFGTVLRGMGTKDHELGVPTLYSKMYYGEPYSYVLSRRNKDSIGKRFLPGGLYVTMFCGMQEPHLYLTTGMVRQGFLRRLILSYCDPSDIERWLPPIDKTFGVGGIYEELYDLSKHVFEKMIEYDEKASKYSPFMLDVELHPRIIDKINDMSRIGDDELKEHVTNLNIYKQSFWEHYAKLAILRAISRDAMMYEKRFDMHHIFVTENDAKEADEFLKRATMYTSDIVTNIGRLEEPIKSAQAPLERVYTIIASKGKISRAELLRKTHMTAPMLNDYLTTLILQDVIKQVVDMSSPGQGRKPVFYEPV